MGRATSYNWEIEIDGKTIHPLSIGEFGEGEEGRVETADGNRKYKVRDQIFNIDEIEVVILITDDRNYYDIMQEWCLKGDIKDIYIIGRNAAGEAAMTFLCSNCDCAMGKKSPFDRKSKSEDTKKYMILPEYVEEII